VRIQKRRLVSSKKVGLKMLRIAEKYMREISDVTGQSEITRVIDEIGDDQDDVNRRDIVFRRRKLIVSLVNKPDELTSLNKALEFHRERAAVFTRLIAEITPL